MRTYLHHRRPSGCASTCSSTRHCHRKSPLDKTLLREAPSTITWGKQLTKSKSKSRMSRAAWSVLTPARTPRNCLTALSSVILLTGSDHTRRWVFHQAIIVFSGTFDTQIQKVPTVALPFQPSTIILPAGLWVHSYIQAPTASSLRLTAN